mmetsp:Transcript_111427/g.314616  ORF Transcript_111427/g.314616 Transcript_111427/m.314616 type:complete len:118 (+) Transcript_111427:79-432(+)
MVHQNRRWRELTTAGKEGDPKGFPLSSSFSLPRVTSWSDAVSRINKRRTQRACDVRFASVPRSAALHNAGARAARRRDAATAKSGDVNANNVAANSHLPKSAGQRQTKGNNYTGKVW